MNTQPNIYISTGAFKTKDLCEIIAICLDLGLKGLELSSGNIPLTPEALLYIEKLAIDNKLSFLVHNYFPVPEKSFVLNLATPDKDQLHISREHCRQAIRICSRVGAPFYSVHAGFCYHAIAEKLGNQQTDLCRFPKSDAYKIFIESIKLLADYAASFQLDILIENNVLASNNLINSSNELFLGVSSAELIDFKNKFKEKNVSILLDVGHLKISAKTLGLAPAEELNAISPYVKAIHLSDNNGLKDTNKKISNNSWFWGSMNNIPGTAKYIIEVYDISPKEIKEQAKIAISQLSLTAK